MWNYIILAGIWIGILTKWLIPVVRKHIVYEIYEACRLGLYFTSFLLNWSWVKMEILPLRIFGFILFVPAAFFVGFGFVNLKSKGKPPSGWEDTTGMIESGVYHIVRHPLYLGSALWAVGVISLIQSLPTTVLGIVAGFCFWMASKKEDEFDIKKFGDGYREYMRKVPRWNFLRGLRRLW